MECLHPNLSPVVYGNDKIDGLRFSLDYTLDPNDPDVLEGKFNFSFFFNTRGKKTECPGLGALSFDDDVFSFNFYGISVEL